MTINEFIKKQGITKEIFAKFVGVSISSVYKYCSGERAPSLMVASKIQKMTKGQVTIKDLLNEESKS